MSQAPINQIPISQPYSQQAPNHYDNDEIDLAELFSKLWKERLVVVLAVLVCGLVGIGYFLITWMQQPTVNTATVELRFNFPSIQNGTYPNGQSFSLNDLVAPAILNQVYDKHQLDQYSVSRSEFNEAIQIAPYATNRAFIEKKFKDSLGSKGLTAAEIDELNKNYAEALDAANLRFAEITFTLNSSLAIPRSVMTTVLASIPSAWTQESIESYGVLDIALANLGQLDRGLIDNYEYMVAAQYLEDYLNYVTTSAEALLEDEVGRLIIDPETQLSVDDVIEELNNLQEFHISVLQRSFAVSPVVRDKQEAVFYLKNQIIVGEERLDQLNRKASVVDRAYEQILRADRASAVPSLPQDSERLGYPTQYGDEFLTRLMSIGDELSESKFKQSLLDRSVELKLSAEEIITRTNSLRKNLTALESNSEVLDTVKNRVADQVEHITNRLEVLAGSINRIATIRSERVLGRSGQLYNLNSEPHIVSNFRDQIIALIKYSIFGAIVGLFLGLFVALVLAIVKSARQSKA